MDVVQAWKEWGGIPFICLPSFAQLWGVESNPLGGWTATLITISGKMCIPAVMKVFFSLKQTTCRWIKLVYVP